MQRPLIRIVDDDKALAGSFGLLLETMGWDTAAYTSGRRFLNNDDLSRPGCIVLDVRMPGLTGPEIQDKLIEMGCRLPIIFLSAHGSIPTAVSAVQKGAVDFLEKPIEPAELIAKINAAVARSVTESVETMHRDRLRARFETLTAREREIIGEILKGDGSETNKQIARTFDLELSTVKMHRSNAFMKLGVHSAAELIRLAQEAGIVFLTAAENLDHPFQLFFPAKHGVKPPLLRKTGQVAAVFVTGAAAARGVHSGLHRQDHLAGKLAAFPRGLRHLDARSSQPDAGSAGGVFEHGTEQVFIFGFGGAGCVRTQNCKFDGLAAV